MKLAHNDTDHPGGTDEELLWRHQGKKAEADGDLVKAAKAYEQDIRKNPLHEDSYRRLMIIYRKLKQPDKEMKVVKKGLSVYTTFYKPGGRATATKKITALSEALLKTTGLADKKGRPVYMPEPLASWNRRLKGLEKKMTK